MFSPARDLFHGPWLYQQDNAPCHRAKVKKWMEDHDVRSPSWPTQSLDLNPIDLQANNQEKAN